MPALECVPPNRSLHGLQGSRMGWLAVSLGFGMSFGVVIFMFGEFPAYRDAAMVLATLVCALLFPSQPAGMATAWSSHGIEVRSP